MAMIRCKACGKAYDAREGFCPQCGAYNRPPRQEWVDAQGTIHYAEQEKECYERKECHEKKVCYEEQTRRPKPQPRRHPPRKNGASGVVGAVIAAVTVVIMVGNLTHYTAFNFGSLFGGNGHTSAAEGGHGARSNANGASAAQEIAPRYASFLHGSSFSP